MTKKEIFISEIEASGIEFSDEAQTFWDAFKAVKEVEKPKFTENGKIVLAYMQESYELFDNAFKAAGIAEGLGISSKTVSGAMRKLVTDGYVDKLGGSPVCYMLSESGKTVNVNE